MGSQFATTLSSKPCKPHPNRTSTPLRFRAYPYSLELSHAVPFVGKLYWMTASVIFSRDDEIELVLQVFNTHLERL